MLRLVVIQIVVITLTDRFCETQPPASIGWVALSSVVRSSRIVTSPLISTIWCFRAYKPYIFCEDMILATCHCQHIFCCWVEPSLLLSIELSPHYLQQMSDSDENIHMTSYPHWGNERFWRKPREVYIHWKRMDVAVENMKDDEKGWCVPTRSELSSQ